MDEYKPKAIKGLKIELNEEIYENITYMSCSNDGMYFETMKDNNVTINIRCKPNEAKIVTSEG